MLARGAAPGVPSPIDTDAMRLDALHAEERSRVVEALRHPGPLTPGLVPAVIALLARDDVSDEAARALGAVADAHVELLVGALCDPDQRFAIRRRLPNVLKRSVSQEAVQGLLDGLGDQRFEVRFRCARALLSLTRRAPQLRVDAGRVMAVLRAGGRGRPGRVAGPPADRPPRSRGRAGRDRRLPSQPRGPCAGARHDAVVPGDATRAAATGVRRAARRRSARAGHGPGVPGIGVARRTSRRACGSSWRTNGRPRARSGPGNRSSPTC